MNVLAITDARYREATRRVVGRYLATLLTAPPVTGHMIKPAMLEGYDAIYIDLHGIPGSGLLYAKTDKFLDPVLSTEVVKAAYLRGVVVIATSCYLPETPFLDAFLERGATVIGGPGVNYGGRKMVAGAQVLARLILSGLAKGLDAVAALNQARDRLWWRQWIDPAVRDALGYELWRPNDQT